VNTGTHFIKNQTRLAGIVNYDDEWAAALEKCREHIRLRLKRRTTFGAHTESRLEEDPYTYYLSYAYNAILNGDWEWKEDHDLSQQMILVADSTISTEVEKVKVEGKKEKKKKVFDDLETMFYEKDEIPVEENMVREILINKQIETIEETIKGDEDLENFWECVKEGMKRAEIATFMEITPKQQDKIRERFIRAIRKSPYFEME
jgi:hypothetical protein